MRSNVIVDVKSMLIHHRSDVMKFGLYFIYIFVYLEEPLLVSPSIEKITSIVLST